MFYFLGGKCYKNKYETFYFVDAYLNLIYETRNLVGFSAVLLPFLPGNATGARAVFGGRERPGTASRAGPLRQGRGGQPEAPRRRLPDRKHAGPLRLGRPLGGALLRGRGFTAQPRKEQGTPSGKDRQPGRLLPPPGQRGAAGRRGTHHRCIPY